MTDQADELRQLVLAGRGRAPKGAPAPRLVAFAGGKGGVGVTTLAVNLAALASLDGQRVVMIDADVAGPDVTELCRLESNGSLADLLAGRASIHDVLERGPAGVQFVAGSTEAARLVEGRPFAVRRFASDLRQLGMFADLVVLDLGSRPTGIALRFWETVDLVVAVTTPEPVAVMGTYAAIKAAAGARGDLSAYVLINRSQSDGEASDLSERIASAGQRFLGMPLESVGWMPQSGELADAVRRRRLFVVESPDAPATDALETIARRLAEAAHSTCGLERRSAA